MKNNQFNKKELITSQCKPGLSKRVIDDDAGGIGLAAMRYFFKSSLSVRPSGFALISTMLIMILMMMIAVAMMSLSNVTSRTSEQGNAKTEAQANARLALMLAIGELQKQMGPDQRISANGSIMTHITASNPQWLGVWDSWKAGDSDTSNPDGFSAHSTITGISDTGMAPTYVPGREDHFRAWLVSRGSTDAPELADVVTSFSGALSMPEPNESAVKLVADGSLGEGSDSSAHVAVPLVDLHSQDGTLKGRYGWWVGDQSQKASLMDDSYEEKDEDGNEILLTDAQKIYRQQAPGSAGTDRVEGLANMDLDTQLNGLPSHNTMDLIPMTTAPPSGSASLSNQNFHHTTIRSLGVLADVREGGLKRDLNTLLERNIDISETSDPFMLYRFDDAGQERVPIQDLAAYYQLYDDDSALANGRRGGISYNSSEISNAIQIKVPDYGSPSEKEKYLREYTALYRNPVPVRIQFLLAVGATPITQADRDYVQGRVDAGQTRYFPKKLRPTDTHKLLLGVMPVVSLWNPSNLPMVIERGNRQIFKFNTPPIATRWKKYRSAGEEYVNGYVNLNYVMSGEGTGDGRARRADPYLVQLKFAESAPVVFEPGEVKMFSLPPNMNELLSDEGNQNTQLIRRIYEPVSGWDPYGFFVTVHSSLRSSSTPDSYHLPSSGMRLFFEAGDQISLEVATEALSPGGRNPSVMNEILGGGFNFWMGDYDYVNGNNGTLHFRNYQFMSRFGGGTQFGQGLVAPFNSELMQQGFPNATAPIPFDAAADSIPGSSIISATQNGEVRAFMMFSMTAGCEASTKHIGGYGGGRRVTSRPFLHGSTISAPLIDSTERSRLYDFGWEWQVDRINSVEEAIQTDPVSGNAFYGGGYTAEAGSTHVIQQYLPVLPPISIASLSHAHLGGFSLANDTVTASASESINLSRFHTNTDERFRGAPEAGDFQQVTATGAAGLAPHVMQAIGNSYAHPNIAADKAFQNYSSHLNHDIGVQQATYADHSYLANKALWDDYFMSSITPQLSKVGLYQTSDDLTAVDLAEEFFFGEGSLPNPRMMRYTSNLTASRFNNLKSKYSDYEDGFADQIASHLMVKGAFNINSTSVEAWKVLFSSLRNKPIAYLEKNSDEPESFTPTDTTPVAPGALPGGEPIPSSVLNSDPNSPVEQWNSWRSLSDTEIDQLSEAMVEQVKIRGPFLSLSELVNRRLDGSNTELSLKGALQAALDDSDVDINAAFRTPERMLDKELEETRDVNGNVTLPAMTAEFTDALKGPIAYGSTPYVDQADILRHLGSVLTPRGDTFIVRTYGDSLAADGSVRARAWCEAVVQRIPDYVNVADSGEVKQNELVSEENKQYGRRIRMVSFRWLNFDEI
ncbi:MAG: hypothetical protein ACJAR1_001098 [Rubritalea sp.]|jgi:hypothetical protein